MAFTLLPSLADLCSTTSGASTAHPSRGAFHHRPNQRLGLAMALPQTTLTPYGRPLQL
ncbi:hypothetical protein [uncultured Hymenobacter sp.]|uniref:hypothetical protein n=1 Tax=uncultured Hymenobacter sp. TaxID=170016 RepID=UPI0035C96240